MRTFIFTLLLTSIITTPAAAINWSVKPISNSQTAVIASDYLSDGVSQTDRDAALQWFRQDDWKLASIEPVIYSRLFVSNLKYAGDFGVEFDFGIGSEQDWLGLTWDFGLLNNFNLALEDVDKYFLEVYAGLKLTDNTALYFTYADDSETFDGGNNAKLHWDHSFQIDRVFSWRYQIGYTDMYRSRLSNSDYIWWNLALDYQLKQLLFSLEYHDTDIQKKQDFNDIAQESLMVKISYNF